MFFTLSKIVWFFLQPSAFFIFLTVAGCLLLWSGRLKWGRRFVSLGAVGLALIAFSPLGQWLIQPLENRFALKEPIKAPTGIIVLGGTIEMIVSDGRGVPSIVSGGERIIEAVKLANKFKQAKILLAGGPNTVIATPTPDAEVVKKMMVAMGIDPARIIVEGKSQNTYQNALYSKAMIDEINKNQEARSEVSHEGKKNKRRGGAKAPTGNLNKRRGGAKAPTGNLNKRRGGALAPTGTRGWYLITSSYHMPRAMGCFRRVGFDVTPYPVDYLTGGPKTITDFFYYSLDGITITDLAVKEWIGLLVYYLTGRTNQFFPAPQNKKAAPNEPTSFKTGRYKKRA